jgi:hypothetical protein
MDAANVNRIRRGWLAILLALMTSNALRAEVFELEGGGRIEGEWINRKEKPLTAYLVRRHGVIVTLPLHQVIDVTRRTPIELEYDNKAPSTADTAVAQWELAEWCRNSGLPAQRKVHLQRVIELDPNHRKARAALGYVFQNGQWTTQEAIRRADGYELYRGKWRTPQEIEILESGSRSDVAQKDWLSRLTRLRRELDEPGKAKAALEVISAIRDPLAIGPLNHMLSRERSRPVKVLYTDVFMAMMADDPSLQPRVLPLLVAAAMRDKDIEVFFDIVERLKAHKHPVVTDRLVDRLSSASNEEVNRAGEALGKLEDKTTISPLIEALVTRHLKVIPGTGATTAGFVGGSFFKKSGDPQVIIVHMQNTHVLTALGKLTGVDFGFDKKAWHNWHTQDKIARESTQTVPDVRRQ